MESSHRLPLLAHALAPLPQPSLIPISPYSIFIYSRASHSPAFALLACRRDFFVAGGRCPAARSHERAPRPLPAFLSSAPLLDFSPLPSSRPSTIHSSRGRRSLSHVPSPTAYLRPATSAGVVGPRGTWSDSAGGSAGGNVGSTVGGVVGGSLTGRAAPKRPSVSRGGARATPMSKLQ